MAWSLAPALDVLRKQVNERAPKRSKTSDGTIGDAAHAARKSDHNPDSRGVVTAIDLTHDPVNGADMNLISERLRLSRDFRIKYVIWNRRYFSPKTNWNWTTYTGPSPHDKHMHVSNQTFNESDTQRWSIDLLEDFMDKFTPEEVAWLKQLIAGAIQVGSNPDSLKTLILDYRERKAAGG